MDTDTLTTRALAAELGCSEPTARRLLSRLHAQGIATRVQTAGRPSYAITRAALAALSGDEGEAACPA